MAQTANFTWPQGEDLLIELIYKEGDTAETAVPVDLSTGYAVRMDIVVPNSKTRVFTFNSAEIVDVDPDQTGDQPDAEIEVPLSSGANGTPNISVSVSRALTLPGGAIYSLISASPATYIFNYDMFLRNTVTDKQARILQGTITVEESNTLWL